MGSVLTLAATVAAAAGAVAAYRFIDRRRGGLGDFLRGGRGRPENEDAVIDYEKDPETGVFRPRA